MATYEAKQYRQSKYRLNIIHFNPKQNDFAVNRRLSLSILNNCQTRTHLASESKETIHTYFLDLNLPEN